MSSGSKSTDHHNFGLSCNNGVDVSHLESAVNHSTLRRAAAAETIGKLIEIYVLSLPMFAK